MRTFLQCLPPSALDGRGGRSGSYSCPVEVHHSMILEGGLMVSSHFHNGNGRQSPPGRQSIHVLLRRLLPVPFFRIPDQKEIIALFASFNAAVCCRRTDA